MKNIRKIGISIALVVLLAGIIFHFYQGRESETKVATLKDKNTYAIQKSIDTGILTEETLSEENCDYQITVEGNVEVMNYKGDEDSVIIPEELEDRKIEKIATDAFEADDQLEMIKMPRSIADKVDEINDFEENEELSDSAYVVYTTTKEYTEGYLAFIELTEEDRQSAELIPDKFAVPLENIYSEEMKELYGDVNAIAVPTKYDLRDHFSIDVENQDQLGICYAFAATKSIETNMMLRHNIVADYSEVHMAFVSGCGERW